MRGFAATARLLLMECGMPGIQVSVPPVQVSVLRASNVCHILGLPYAHVSIRVREGGRCGFRV